MSHISRNHVNCLQLLAYCYLGIAVLQSPNIFYALKTCCTKKTFNAFHAGWGYFFVIYLRSFNQICVLCWKWILCLWYQYRCQSQAMRLLYCTVLYCTVLCCTVLYCTVQYCAVLYCIVLYSTGCIVLYYTVQYCAVLYCTMLYCTVLYSTVLYCTVPIKLTHYWCVQVPCLISFYGFQFSMNIITSLRPAVWRVAAVKISQSVLWQEAQRSYCGITKIFNFTNMNSAGLRSGDLQLLTPRVPILLSSCGFKVKNKLKRRCKDCYFVVRQGRVFVICDTHPRHKQMSMKAPDEVNWILTHATQSPVRPWWCCVMTLVSRLFVSVSCCWHCDVEWACLLGVSVCQVCQYSSVV
jgi:large subunit ribosomal protein L36